MEGRADGALIAGVVGRPIGYSLSPLIHNSWIKALNLNAVYVGFSAPTGGLTKLLHGLSGMNVVGLNVTAPFKVEALALADTADRAATEAGSTNLLLLHDARIEARNTDGLGLLAALAEQAPALELNGAQVLVLGAGGAASGAVAALARVGTSVRIVNRTRERALALADRFDGVEAIERTDLRPALARTDLLVNATSMGSEPLADTDLERLPDHAVVMDMTYRPLETPLLAMAQARGLKCVDGLAMLIGQARPSFQALFGAPPPASVDVRSLALDVLKREGG